MHTNIKSKIILFLIKVSGEIHRLKVRGVPMEEIENNMRTSDNFVIEQATEKHLDEMEILYDTLNDHLQAAINYPGWIKGIYPTRETAECGIKNNTLYVLIIDKEIAGSVILNHEPETPYSTVTWGIETEYENVVVIHTLAVHPKYINMGVGKKLMDFSKIFSLQQKMLTIRLDVSIHNAPAIKLYEKCGYQFVETVDMWYPSVNLLRLHLYEIIL
jgi:ribosomal protein S18 acetylase RimI-like enzyme